MSRRIPKHMRKWITGGLKIRKWGGEKRIQNIQQGEQLTNNTKMQDLNLTKICCLKKNNYKYKQKQTYSLFLLIIPLNVKREVNEELTTAFLFVQFLAMSPLCYAWAPDANLCKDTHNPAYLQQVVCCTL